MELTYPATPKGGSIAATMGAAGTGRPDAEASARAMGATIRALRGYAHISQIELGRRVGTHANYLGALERGEIASPGLTTVDRVARGLGVSIAVLAESYATAPPDGALRVDTTGGRPERRTSGSDAKALGEAIRIVRRHLDITQAQLADAIGLHRNQVGSIEVGEKASRGIATIACVAHGLTLQMGAGEHPLLPLLAQVFNGEVALAAVRERFASKPSGSSVARTFPHVGADD